MPVYTVHEPPSAEVNQDADRFVFVRDGFHGWALLAPPLWLLWNRLWTALTIYTVVVGFGLWGMRRFGFSGGEVASVYVLSAILIGLEASSIRRWTLRRRRWRDLGIVMGETLAHAEQRFFDRFVQTHPSGPTLASAPMRGNRRPVAENDVIGLFPQPGART